MNMLRNWGCMCFNPVGDQKQSVPTEKNLWHPEIKKCWTVFWMQKHSEGCSAKNGSYQCLVIPHTDLLNMLFSKVTFNTWKLKIHLSNTFQKIYLKLLPLRIKLGRNRTWVNKNVTQSPRQKNHQYKTADPSEIHTRWEADEELKNPKELLNEENLN